MSLSSSCRRSCSPSIAIGHLRGGGILLAVVAPFIKQDSYSAHNVHQLCLERYEEGGGKAHACIESSMLRGDRDVDGRTGSARGSVGQENDSHVQWSSSDSRSDTFGRELCIQAGRSERQSPRRSGVRQVREENLCDAARDSERPDGTSR